MRQIKPEPRVESTAAARTRKNHHTGSVRNLPTMNAHACRYRSSFHHAELAAGGATTTCAASPVHRLPRLAIADRPPHDPHREKIPVTRNAARHPKCSATHGTTSGARIAPTPAPELKMPVASARSFGGNHSAVALIAAGKFPLSPRPRKNRAIPKPITERTSACAIAARLHNPVTSGYPLRHPSRSTSRPANTTPSAYAT